MRHSSFRTLCLGALVAASGACGDSDPVSSGPAAVETRLIVDVVTADGTPVAGAVVQVSKPASLTGSVWSRTTNVAGRAEVYDQWPDALEWMHVSITVQPPPALGLAARFQPDSVRFELFPVRPYRTTVVVSPL